MGALILANGLLNLQAVIVRAWAPPADFAAAALEAASVLDRQHTALLRHQSR